MDDRMMDSLDNIKDLIRQSLDEIVSRGDISKEELCSIKEAVEVVEKILHIERDGEYEEGQSQRNYYIRDWDYPQTGYMPEYERGNSYANGRNSRNGRYMNRYDNGGGSSYRGGNYNNGNSYAGGDREYMIQTLEMAMNEASTEQERNAIRECLNKMK